jgi:SAM-dependent methyltransferase
VTPPEGWGFATDWARLLFSRHLIGEGIELGPGHHPYVLRLPGTRVKYVDRWAPEVTARLFPELGDDAKFPEPDIIADLDTDRLAALGDMSQDFVIASHVLEHVSNPLALIAECFRVLVPGGVLLLLLPDRRHTFDASREPTPLAHVIQDYNDDAREVSIDHLDEFATVVDGFNDTDQLSRQLRFEQMRLRSIHVHCWTEDEFFEVLIHVSTSMGMCWELVEMLCVDDAPGNFEFGYILRRGLASIPPGTSVERLWATKQMLMDFRSSEETRAAKIAAALEVAERAQSEAEKKCNQLEQIVAHQSGQLDIIRRSPFYPALRAGVRAYRRVAQSRSSVGASHEDPGRQSRGTAGGRQR